MVNGIRKGEQNLQVVLWMSEFNVDIFDIHVRQYSDNYDIWMIHNNLSIERLKKIIPWVKHKNANGADIYFRPYCNGSYSIVFLDDVSRKNALSIASKYAACVIETSPNNCQIWLACDKPMDKAERKTVQTRIRDLGYTDAGSISGDHLGRLPGFKSWKHSGRCWVNLIKTTKGKPYSPIISPPANKPEAKDVHTTSSFRSKQGHHGGACALGYRHKPGQNFHGKKNKRRALNIKFGLDKVL